jgi:hypothetical protein
MSTTVNTAAAKDPAFCVDTNGNVPIELLGAAGSAHRLAVSRGLNAITMPDTGAGTPTYDGYSLALDPLVNLTTVTVNPDQKFMLLITDGMPTFDQGCLGYGAEELADHVAFYARITQQVAAARAQGIRTFVIGSPGSEASEKKPNLDLRPFLSAVATAGGTAQSGCSDAGPHYCHFDMSAKSDFSTGLTDALNLIASTMVACNYTVPAAPNGLVIDTDQVAIIYTPSTTNAATEKYLVAQSKDPNCPAGWRYTNDAKTAIEICGRTCEKLTTNPEARLDIGYSCEFPNKPE